MYYYHSPGVFLLDLYHATSMFSLIPSSEEAESSSNDNCDDEILPIYVACVLLIVGVFIVIFTSENQETLGSEIQLRRFTKATQLKHVSDRQESEENKDPKSVDEDTIAVEGPEISGFLRSVGCLERITYYSDSLCLVLGCSN